MGMAASVMPLAGQRRRRAEVGDKNVAIDPSALKVTRGDGDTLKATIDTTKDQLRAAPEYIYLGKEKPKDAQATSPARQP